MAITPDRQSPVRVLLVDDDPRLRSLGRKVLERSGYEVALASDGDEAVALATSDEFDVILMDLSMPKMDGYEALRAIRAIRPGLPVIALTAHAMKSDQERCLQEGFDQHVSKPFRTQQLVATVAAFAAKARAALAGRPGEVIEPGLVQPLDAPAVT